MSRSIAAGATMFGRALAESAMESTCRIERIGKAGELNESTGKVERPRTTVYEGPCRLKFESSVVGEVDAQSRILTQQTAVLAVPVAGSEAVRVGDVATITANPLDAGLVGRELRINSAHAQTHATARRFQAELTT